MTQPNWSEDRVERLQSLWQEGLSASQIAHALGGVSRNAVIGKVHRLGFAGRATPAEARRTWLPSVRKPRAVHEPAPVIEEEPFQFEDGTFATMRTINNAMCRWPIGDPTTDAFHFCGCLQTWLTLL